MAHTNDASIANSNVDIESQIQTPRKTHQRPQLGTGFDQTPSIREQDRPDPPQDTPRSLTKRRLYASTTDRKILEQTQLTVANVIDANALEKAWILEAKKQKPFDAMQITFPVAFRRGPGSANPLEHAGQVLLLCFDRGSRGQCSVRVPCRRPTRYRTSIEMKLALKKGRAETTPPGEKGFESDSQIVGRMRETIESELGRWAKFVPYFGVIGAEIVEFKFLHHYPGHKRQPITISEREEGPSFIEKTLEEYNHTERLSKQIRDGPDGCDLPIHVSKCPTSQDPVIPCTLDGKRKGNGKTCRADPKLHHDGSFCHSSEGEECIEWQRDFAVGVGKPGIKAFKRLPEWLRQPGDVIGLQLSRWLQKQNLIQDSSKTLGDQIDKTHRGLRFKVGWDFDRMRAKLPGQLALAVVAGSVVWLSVILWATETDDLSTALAAGSLLIGVFALLLDHIPKQ